MAQLYFHYSAMNAGKSTSLLQSAHNYREQGMAVAIHTAAIDDRYGHGVVRSRIGLSAEASLFDASTDFLADTRSRMTGLATRGIDRLACVFVDEAQFLNGAHVEQLARAVDELGVPVLCYGLRTDFRGELFPGSARLLAVADKLVELKTVCRCGRKATMTVRLDADHRVVAAGAQVEIGGNERYESMCRRHYRESMAAAESP